MGACVCVLGWGVGGVRAPRAGQLIGTGCPGRAWCSPDGIRRAAAVPAALPASGSRQAGGRAIWRARLARPHEPSAGLERLRDHVINEAVFVPDASLLVRGSPLGLVDLSKDLERKGGHGGKGWKGCVRVYVRACACGSGSTVRGQGAAAVARGAVAGCRLCAATGPCWACPPCPAAPLAP